MSEQVGISKMEVSASDSATERMRLTEVGVPFLKGVGGWVETEARRELSGRHRLKTYDRMRQDSAVNTALSAAEVFLLKQLVQKHILLRVIIQ